jgi:hypothetical protein
MKYVSANSVGVGVLPFAMPFPLGNVRILIRMYFDYKITSYTVHRQEIEEASKYISANSVGVMGIVIRHAVFFAHHLPGVRILD